MQATQGSSGLPGRGGSVDGLDHFGLDARRAGANLVVLAQIWPVDCSKPGGELFVAEGDMADAVVHELVEGRVADVGVGEVGAGGRSEVAAYYSSNLGLSRRSLWKIAVEAPGAEGA